MEKNSNNHYSCNTSSYRVDPESTVKDIDLHNFVITVEVVPPKGADPEKTLSALEALNDLPVHGFSVASNPVAKPHMCAMALSALIQKRTGKFATLHCTTRDHNRISLQSTLWGAKALGLKHVMVATGDFVSLDDKLKVSNVKDINVYELIAMAKESGMNTGAVFDFRPESNGLDREIERLEKKVAAGAEFAVTQPIYDRDTARTISISTSHINIPIIMGVLPLRTSRHAEFLHNRVAGISIPDRLREKMADSADPLAVGIENAREMLTISQEFFRGACIMPPFDHYEMVTEILK